MSDIQVVAIDGKIVMTVDEFKAINRQIREDAIDEYIRELKAYMRRLGVIYVSDEDFNYIAEKVKEQNNTYTATVDGVKREFM